MQKRKVLLAFSAILVLAGSSPVKRSTNSDEEDFEESYVGLIISPILSSTEIREIEIYWTHSNLKDGDTISLYTEEPSVSLAAAYSFQPDNTSGIKSTGIYADYVATSNLTYQRQCLKYHVAWIRNSTIMTTNCLETRPNWMADRKDSLGSLKLSQIFIPGSHDSGAYSKLEEAQSDNLISKYVITQDEDILAQLIYGIRYLDIRVGYYSALSTVWWANHGIVRVVPLQDVIDDVKAFLDNTEEIVIFDVQEFPVGFGDDLTVHKKLVAYLEEEFADYLLPKSYGWSSTLNTIWSSGKRLIIGYDESDVVALYDTIWTCVSQQWGDVRTVSDLYTYLNRVETAAASSSATVPRSTMAELTPNTLDVLLDRLGGLRKMAKNVDMNVTMWYSTEWHSTANIVAVDFFKGSGIVETAIEWNDKRASN